MTALAPGQCAALGVGPGSGAGSHPCSRFRFLRAFCKPLAPRLHPENEWSSRAARKRRAGSAIAPSAPRPRRPSPAGGPPAAARSPAFGTLGLTARSRGLVAPARRPRLPLSGSGSGAGTFRVSMERGTARPRPRGAAGTSLGPLAASLAARPGAGALPSDQAQPPGGLWMGLVCVALWAALPFTPPHKGS